MLNSHCSCKSGVEKNQKSCGTAKGSALLTWSSMSLTPLIPILSRKPIDSRSAIERLRPSHSYVSNLRQQYKLDMPTIFVASKSDLDLAVQRHEVQPDVYCRRLLLRPPIAVNHRHTGDLWTQICSVAMQRAYSSSIGIFLSDSSVIS